MSFGTPHGRFQDVIRTNLGFWRKRSFLGSRALLRNAHRRQPTTGIGPMGEAVTSPTLLRHDHDPHRLETSAAPARIGSFASKRHGWSLVLLALHHRIRPFPHCEMDINALPSPPAMLVKHTARHRLLRRQPTPGEHRYCDRRSQPPFGAKMCVSTVYVIPIAPQDRQTVEVPCERDQITGRGGGAW